MIADIEEVAAVPEKDGSLRVEFVRYRMRYYFSAPADVTPDQVRKVYVRPPRGVPETSREWFARRTLNAQLPQTRPLIEAALAKLREAKNDVEA